MQDQESERLNQAQNEDITNAKWFTEAYDDFKDRICDDYLLVKDVKSQNKFEIIMQKLEMKPGNSSHKGTDVACCLSYTFACFLCPIIWWKTRNVFKVPKNSFAMVIEEADEGRKTQLYGPGFHIIGFYNKLEGIYSFDDPYRHNIIESSVGDFKIATVHQGTIMHLECEGQNIILGPGIHKITEPMTYIQTVRLDSFYIKIGPEKWVTVPDGYDGISINNGKIKILHGGKQHHLTHIGDKFAKMVPKTLQTDRVSTDIPLYVQRLEQGSIASDVRSINDPSEFLKTTSAEGSNISLDVMVFWKIIDTELASRTAMEILKVEGGANDNRNQAEAIKASSKNITMLRQNVLRMCKNHITALVGTCSLAGKTSMQSTAAKKQVPQTWQKEDEIEDVDELQPRNVQQSGRIPAQNYFGQNQGDNGDLGDENDNLLIQQQQVKSPKIDLKQVKQNSQLQYAKQSSHQQNQQEAQQTEDNANNESATFGILGYLQNEAISLKDLINNDLMKIGCVLENICIYSVIPDQSIQNELDKQTKARVYANTDIIKALADRESSQILENIQAEISLEKAKCDAEVRKMRAQASADYEKTKAHGEAESIRLIARARKVEAEEIESVQIAQDLAELRCAGEAGEKIFANGGNQYYGKNPADVLFGMVKGFQQQS